MSHSQASLRPRRDDVGCDIQYNYMRLTVRQNLGGIPAGVIWFAAEMAISELACTYAALILHDDGIPITADKISTLVKAANVEVEAYFPGLFAKLFERRSVDDLISSVGSGGGGAVAVSGGGGAAAGGGGAAAAPAEEKKVEKKKEEEKEESDDDMGFSLFD